MQCLFSLMGFALVLTARAAPEPNAFGGLFAQGVMVRGQVGVMQPPPEIEKYVAKVTESARKNPEWFRGFSKQHKPGVPLPYDERLGLTREEYAEYLAVWKRREFKALEEVTLTLRKSPSGTWGISGSGAAALFATLRYDEKSDSFSSPNGELKRIADIEADPESILGAWSGREWKFEEDTGLGKLKENLAIGVMADKRHGLLVYRAQEISTQGTRLLDRSLVIRFPAAAVKQGASSRSSGGKSRKR